MYLQRLLTGLWLLALLNGCTVTPERPYVDVPNAGSACTSPANIDAGLRTPEMPNGGHYQLHFVEFDDQGWLFPNETGQPRPDTTPSRQIDCAVAGIANQLAAGQQVLSFVYVHGWKHSADTNDANLNLFRRFLASRASLFPTRKIVGIYVGWQGNTLDVPGIRNLTFWGRKNAADHVADGRVRELFSRIKGLRDHWNGPAAGASRTQDCDWAPSATDRCALRTIMIGHSFGGLILYNSVAPYVLETLTSARDIPPSQERAKAKRARGIADLIILLNPAFEATRYEPVFEASQHYRRVGAEPPLLVILTSTADWATKNAFPVARWINSVFQYPASSDAESHAMRRTPGHTERNLTHELCLQRGECDGREPGTAVSWRDPRRLCDGLLLGRYAYAASGDTSIVWNVRTHGDIIPDHNTIDRPEVFSFIQQLYGQVDGTGQASCQGADNPVLQTP